MHRLNVSLAQFVQALAIAGVGIAIAFVPLALVWALDRSFGPDIVMMWRMAADAWLLGHGVTLSAQLPEAVAVQFGENQALQPFDVTLWPLGFAVLTFVLSYRSGLALESAASGMAADHLERIEAFGGVARPQRIFGDVLLWGVAGSTVTTALVGFALAFTAQHENVSPSIAQATFMPALVSLVGHVAAILWRHHDTILTFVLERLTVPEEWAGPIRAGLRMSVIVVVTLLGLGAAATALTFFTHFDRILAISEASSPTVLGALVLFLAQLAVLPNAILWSTAWLIGAPVQLGTGSTLSAFEVSLGPLPGIPIFGAVPSTVEPWFLALVALTALAVIALGMIAARRLMPDYDEWRQPLVAAVTAALIAGAVIVAGSVLSAGAIGPGRMQELGPATGPVAAIAFGGLALAMSAAFYGSRLVDVVIGLDDRPNEKPVSADELDDEPEAEDYAKRPALPPSEQLTVEISDEPARDAEESAEDTDKPVGDTDPDREP